MVILAIETSCDDTCVAILKSKIQKPKTEFPFMETKVKKRTKSSSPSKSFEILSNVVSSQVEIHKKWGGVYPSLAKREHQKNLPIVLKTVLKEAKLALSDSRRVDLIAVTVGPGLEPCLWVGVNFAIELAKKLKVPLIPANHIEAHILINFLHSKFYILNSKLFPAVCLVVSGGHTQLILMQGIGKYRILGETRDDAAGECFDKTARILGLGYPGGPAIAQQAAQWKSQIPNSKFQICLPRPMIYQKNYDFSFSGLKTAVLYDFKSRPPKIRKSKEYIGAIAAEAQQAVIDVLIKKTLRAAKDFKAKAIILGGGVAANEELRKQFKAKIKKDYNPPTAPYFYIPDSKFCTDNAVMTAITGYYHRKKAQRENLERIEAKANLRLE